MEYIIIGKEEAKELTGWKSDMDQEYHGVVPGLLCGWNFEVTTRSGRKDFFSCMYKCGDPEETLNSGYNREYLEDCGCTPTGRVIFRGYFEEYYDYEEREECVRSVDMNEVFHSYVKE